MEKKELRENTIQPPSLDSVLQKYSKMKFNSKFELKLFCVGFVFEQLYNTEERFENIDYSNVMDITTEIYNFLESSFPK